MSLKVEDRETQEPFTSGDLAALLNEAFDHVNANPDPSLLDEALAHLRDELIEGGMFNESNHKFCFYFSFDGQERILMNAWLKACGQEIENFEIRTGIVHDFTQKMLGLIRSKMNDDARRRANIRVTFLRQATDVPAGTRERVLAQVFDRSN